MRSSLLILALEEVGRRLGMGLDDKEKEEEGKGGIMQKKTYLIPCPATITKFFMMSSLHASAMDRVWGRLGMG
jgi:hypothetical protein